MKIAVFDLESKELVEDWNQPHKAGLACAALWTSWQGGKEGRLQVFDEEGIGRLIRNLQAADLVVTYNGIRFDVPFLEGLTGDRLALAQFDLLDSIKIAAGRRYSLEDVARSTLGRGKGGKGCAAPTLHKQSRFADLHSYCLEDVVLTRDLFLFAREFGYVLIPGEKAALQVFLPTSSKALHHSNERAKNNRAPASDRQVRYLRTLKGDQSWKPIPGFTKEQAAREIDHIIKKKA